MAVVPTLRSDRSTPMRVMSAARAVAAVDGAVASTTVPSCVGEDGEVAGAGDGAAELLEHRPRRLQQAVVGFLDAPHLPAPAAGRSRPGLRGWLAVLPGSGARSARSRRARTSGATSTSVADRPSAARHAARALDLLQSRIAAAPGRCHGRSFVSWGRAQAAPRRPLFHFENFAPVRSSPRVSPSRARGAGAEFNNGRTAPLSGETHMQVQFKVNGKAVSVDVAPNTLLVRPSASTCA
jgi:hypothetical protein